MPVSKDLVSVDDALGASKAEVKRWYREYVNPDFELTLELVGFDEIYKKAEGTKVYSGEKEYLDFLGGYGVLTLGHNNPEIIKELDKIKDRPNILQASLSPLAAALGKNLALVTPGKLNRSFFCNSGAEAVEGALKTARAATGRRRIIYTKGSFHGKTLGALSATGKEKYQAPFRPLLPGFESVSFGDADALERKLSSGDIAAFIVEPIQGESGVIVPPDGYLKKAEELCQKQGVLLIVDEVQTGLGRTGDMFACEHEGVEPDIICLAKALGGALMPMGAFVTTQEVWQRVYGGLDKYLLHTSTFGGPWSNIRACAAAIATLNLLCQDGGRLIKEAKEKGEYFLSQLKQLEKEHRIVKHVRGRGLIIGVEFAQPKPLVGIANRLFREYFASLVASRLRNEYQVITAYTLSNPNVIRLEPSLMVTKEEIDTVVKALNRICSEGYSKTLIQRGWAAGRVVGKRVTKRKSKK